MKRIMTIALLALATLSGQAQVTCHIEGELFFRTDSAVIRGRIEGYSQAMGFRNMSAQVSDFFTNELKTATADIREDGTFEKRLLLHHPVLNWFYTSEALISRQQVPFYLCPGDTLNITLCFRDGDIPECEYRGGHSAEVARLLKVRTDYLDLLSQCSTFGGDIEAFNQFADSLYTTELRRVDELADEHRFTPLERRLARCSMATAFGTAYLSYFSQIEVRMAQDDPAAPYQTGNAVMGRLSRPECYPLLRRLPNEDSLMLATKFFSAYLNRLEFAAPFRYPLFVRRGLVWGNSREEVVEQLTLCRDTGRSMFGQSEDVLPEQLLQLHTLGEAMGEWLEGGTAEDDFRATLPFLTHPVIAATARQMLDEMAEAAPTLPLPEGDAADFVRRILTLYPGRYVVLDFWAMWCGPCKAEIRATRDFRQRLCERSDVKFVFLANEPHPNRPDYLDFVRECLAGEENVAIDDARFHQLQDLFGFNAIPFNATLTPDGRIVRDGLLLRFAEAGYDHFIQMLEEMKAKAQ